MKLNRGELQLRLKEVMYMGHMLSADGLQANPEKVMVIREMPVPTNGIQRLLWMTNYCTYRSLPQDFQRSRFLYAKLTKKDEFLWDEEVHGAALEETKKILSTTPVLKYFDPDAMPTPV